MLKNRFSFSKLIATGIGFSVFLRRPFTEGLDVVQRLISTQGLHGLSNINDNPLAC